MATERQKTNTFTLINWIFCILIFIQTHAFVWKDKTLIPSAVIYGWKYDTSKMAIHTSIKMQLWNEDKGQKYTVHWS